MLTLNALFEPKEDRRTRVRKSVVDLMIAGLITSEDGLAAIQKLDESQTAAQSDE